MQFEEPLNEESIIDWMNKCSTDQSQAARRQLFSSEGFQNFINKAVHLYEDLCIDLIKSSSPELISVLQSSTFCEKLTAKVLEDIDVTDSTYTAEIRLQRLRLLASKRKNSVLDSAVILALIKISSNFLYYSKLMVLFPSFNVLDYVLREGYQVFQFWNEFLQHFFRCNDSGVTKLLLFVQNEIFRHAESSQQESNEWQLFHDDRNRRKVFSDLCFSLNQCASNTMNEHMAELTKFMLLANRGEISVSWLLMLLRISFENHSSVVLRQSVHVFSLIKWQDIEITDQDWKLVELFLTNSFQSVVMKQLVFETPPLSHQIIQPLENIFTLSHSCYLSAWKSIIQYSGNYLTKLHYLQTFVRCGRKGLKLEVSEMHGLRECIASYACVAEPLRSSLLVVSFKCGIYTVEWERKTFEDLLAFLRSFKEYSFDLISAIEKEKDICSAIISSLTNCSPKWRNIEDSLSSYGATVADIIWENRLFEILEKLCSNLFDKRDPLSPSSVISHLVPKLCERCESEKDFNMLEDFIKFNFSKVPDNEFPLCQMQAFVTDSGDSSMEWVCVLLTVSEIPLEETSMSIVKVLLDCFIKSVTSKRSNSRKSVREQVLTSYDWKALSVFFKHYKCSEQHLDENLELCEKRLIDSALEILETAPLFLVDSVLCCLSESSEIYKNPEKFDELCSVAIENCLIYCRKEAGSESFNSAFQRFVDLVFCSESFSNESLALTVSKCANVIMKDCKAFSFLVFANNVANSLIKSQSETNAGLSKEEQEFDLLKFFELHNSWFVHMATSYSLRLGYEVVMPVLLDDCFHDVTSEILQVMDQVKNLQSPRKAILSVLETLANSFKNNTDTFLTLLKQFIVFDIDVTSNITKRLHVNSFIHQQKIRVWSSVCKLIMSFEHCEMEGLNEIRSLLLNSLKSDYCDPSLRVFMEVSLSYLLPRFLWTSEIVQDLGTSSSSYVCSVIHSVGYRYLFDHNYSSLILDENEVNKLFTFLFSWSTVSHNSIRLSAQAFLMRIWESHLLVNRNNETTGGSFVFIDSVVTFWKSHQKLLEAIEKNSHVMIFYEDLFSKFKNLNKNSKICFEDIYSCVAKRYALEDEIEGLNPNLTRESETKFQTSDATAEFSSTSQLKPVSELDLATVFTQEYKMVEVKLHRGLQEEKRPGNLILIASLLEKMNNIGGLSRTGEVQVVNCSRINVYSFFLSEQSLKQ